MLLSLRDRVLGAVSVEVRGFAVERFINLAANKGVCLRDVTRLDDGTARMSLSVKGFKLLKGCAKKTKCKVRIVRKEGLPFFAFRHRKRKLLAIGAAVCLCALYVLTSFVWAVGIEGAERLDAEALRGFLAAEGLASFTRKAKVDERALERALLAQFGDIAFVHIQLEGVRAVVRLAETIPTPERVDLDTPRDLIARADGLIMSVAASSGTPMVKAGDVVRAGDILVSGELAVGEPGGEMHYTYVRAEAEVLAKLYYEMEFDVPLAYTEKSFTGNHKTIYSIIIAGKTWALFTPRVPYAHYEKMVYPAQWRFGADFPLPIVWVREVYREFEPVTVYRTAEEAERRGAELVTNRLLREFADDVILVDKQLSFTETESAVRVAAQILTVESIAAERAVKKTVPEEEQGVE